MMIDVQIAEQLDAEALALDAAPLERAARAALLFCRAQAGSELALVLSDDTQLQALNRQFLEIDAPTDVLSFPAGEADPETGAVYVGDVIISYPRAQAQAAAGGHPVAEELQLLVVHGVLHLMGYDHAEEGQKAEMWAAQAQILKDLGSSLTAPAF